MFDTFDTPLVGMDIIYYNHSINFLLVRLLIKCFMFLLKKMSL